MYRVMMMMGLMIATALMGIVLTVVSIQQFGEPQDVVDVHRNAVERMERLEATDPGAPPASGTARAR